MIGVDPDRDKIITYRHSIAVRGEGPLRVLEYHGLPDGPPTCLLRSLDAKAYREHIAGLLEIPPAPPIATVTQPLGKSEQIECASCGQLHDARARFCPWCGASRSQPTPKRAADRRASKAAAPADRAHEKPDYFVDTPVDPDVDFIPDAPELALGDEADCAGQVFEKRRHAIGFSDQSSIPCS